MVAVDDLVDETRHDNKIPIYRIKPKEVTLVEPTRFPMQSKSYDEKLDKLARMATPDDGDEEDEVGVFEFDYQDDRETGEAMDREITDVARDNEMTSSS